MNWRWWEKGPRELSRGVKKHLQKEFSLLSCTLDCLQMATKRGPWSGKSSILIRVFDPERVKEVTLLGVDYNSFECRPDSNLFCQRMSGVVLFDGYQQGRFISFTDKRK